MSDNRGIRIPRRRLLRASSTGLAGLAAPGIIRSRPTEARHRDRSGITPLFFDDFSSGAIDWSNKWLGAPIGYRGTSTANPGGRGGGNSWAPDQSVVQADCRSVKIVRSGGKHYLINTAFIAPTDRPAVMQPYRWATAEICSRFSHRYGYIVGRCKQPIGDGCMGAFWQYFLDNHPDPRTNRDFEEIDLTENPNHRQGTMTVHTSDPNFTHGANKYTIDFDVGDGPDHWHVYSVEWEAPPGNITFYLDGQRTWQKYTPSDLVYRMNIWVSIYVAAPGNDPKANWFGNMTSDSTWPQRSVYDWIGWFDNKT